MLVEGTNSPETLNGTDSDDVIIGHAGDDTLFGLGGADVFNFGQARQGQSDDKQLDNPGLYTLQCDVHPWMQCWVMALPSRVFGVSETDGTCAPNTTAIAHSAATPRIATELPPPITLWHQPRSSMPIACATCMGDAESPV